jgi:hypothetical protein
MALIRRNKKGVGKGDLISLKTAISIAANPPAAVKKTREKSAAEAAKTRAKHTYSAAFFEYADTSRAGVNQRDDLITATGLTVITEENNFYKNAEGLPMAFNADGKTRKGKVCFGVEANPDNKVVKKSKAWHMVNIPIDATLLDYAHWVTGWPKKPKLIRLGKQTLIIGKASEALKPITTPDPVKSK